MAGLPGRASRGPTPCESLGPPRMFGDRTVHLRPARGDAVKLPLPGHADHPVAVRPHEVKVGNQDCLLGFTRFGKDLASEIYNLRMAREAESTLLAYTVRHNNVKMVLRGANLGGVLPGV